MPLVRIEIPTGKPPSYATTLGQAVQEAMHQALGVPMEERFQIITEHHCNGLVVDPSYLVIHRSTDTVVIQVFLNNGRDAPKKAMFFAALARGLHTAVGLLPADLVINLVEVTPEDWSFGNGEAQLVSTKHLQS